jgi:hypothetical protein
MKRVYVILCIVMYAVPAAAGIFDNVSLNARPAGMGEAFSSVWGGMDSIYYNPAGLTRQDKAQVLFSYRDFYGLKLVNQKYAGFSVPERLFSFAFSWHRIGESVDFLDYKEDVFMLTLSGIPKGLSDLSAGVNFKFFRVFSQANASGYGMDAGVQYSTFKRRLRLGACLRNLNNVHILWDTGAEDVLKSHGLLGASYYMLDPLLLSLDYVTLGYCNFGAEVTVIKNIFMLRGGAKRINEKTLSFTGGMSFGYDNLQFDYAITRHPSLGITHFFSLNINIKKIG